MTAGDLVSNPMFPYLVMLAMLLIAFACIAQYAERRAVRAEKKLVTLYDRLLDERKTDATSIIESALRIATTGSPDRPVAIVQHQEPSAEELVRSRVIEDTIANGMNRLREMYQQQGMTVPPDEVLREEVEMMIAGVLPESATAGSVRA